MADEIAHLRGLDLGGLRRRWRSTFRKEAPSHFARHLLLAILAYRIQADALGELDPATVRLLDSVGSGRTDVEAARPSYEVQRLALQQGTILMREWNGRPRRVMVTEDGFVWKGKIFDSLSAVAFAVTGTKWNGHRFFGLR